MIEEVDWTIDEYNADTTRVRSTHLKLFMQPQGPRAYYWNAKPASTSMKLGTLIHSYILEGRKDWVVCDMRRDVRTKAYQEFLLANDGKYIASEKEDYDLRGMIDGLNRNKRAVSFLTDNAFAEETILFDHESTGIQAKARIDLFSATCLADLKTTVAQDEESFVREVIKRGYNFSAAFYELARDAFVGRRVHAPFYFVVVSNKFPYYSYVWQLGDDLLIRGHRFVENAFKRLKECREEEELCIKEGRPVIEAWPDDHEQLQDTQVLVEPAWAYDYTDPGTGEANE